MEDIYGTNVKAYMKKIARIAPLLLALNVINVATVCLSFTQKAEAVTRSEWEGTWDCNLDGRPLQVAFRIHYGLVVGKIGDDYWAVLERDFDPSLDPSTDRKDHVLPLTIQSNQTKLFLAMHTWDQRYASGFSRWNGTVYGISCSRK